MMLCKNKKAMVNSPDGYTDFFHVGVLERNALAPDLFLQNNVLQTSLDLISRRYFEMTDTDYADNLAPLTNTPARRETLLHKKEQAARDMGLNLNANKIELMCFNQKGAIFTLNDKPLK